MPASTTTLLTFGHGTADQARLVELLQAAGTAAVVDIRRFPGSRRHPHTAREELERWLPEAGVAYRWEPRLGGRRSRAADDDAPGPADPWWQVAAFAAYAAHMRTDEFRAAMTDLLAGAAQTPTAVMCSETLWWRCHRRLVSDAAVLLHGVEVQHLGHDGRLGAHRPAAGARVTGLGLVYDLADESPAGEVTPRG